MRNTEISKLLGQEWKCAPAHVRQPHIDKEAVEREEYHRRVAAWRERKEEEKRSPQNIDKSGDNTVHDEQVDPQLEKLPPCPPDQDSSNARKTPRELIPIAPKVSGRVTHFVTHRAEEIPEPDIPPGLDGDSNVDFDDMGESLIPTIFPAVNPPTSPLQARQDAAKFADIAIGKIVAKAILLHLTHNCSNSTHPFYR